MDNKEYLNKKKIYLTYLNGTGYVFNAEDYMKIRTDYRMTGSLVGTNCSRGWSGKTISLPVELSRFETQILLEKELAILLRKSHNILRQPREEEIQQYKSDVEMKLRQQEDHLRDGKVKESINYIDKIMYGKRKKLIKSGICEEDIKLTKEDVLQEIRDSVEFKQNNALVEIHCEHPRIHEGTVLELSKDCSLKYRVFKHFWECGKYVTCGEAFGADFIVYPGDPIVYHASHIIIVQDKPTLQPLELIAKVRLSVIVNKICVFAYEGEQNEVYFQTVLWEGNKDCKT